MENWCLSINALLVFTMTIQKRNEISFQNNFFKEFIFIQVVCRDDFNTYFLFTWSKLLLKNHNLQLGACNSLKIVFLIP